MSNTSKIAVIEDEDSLRDALVLKLRNNGYHTIAARDGKEGLEMCLEEKPDLILLDLIMPEMDGIEVLKRLRADIWGRNARVICLTNRNVDNETTDMLENYKPLFFLVKTDVSLEEVMEKVKESLE